MFVCTGSSLAPRTRCIPSPACGEGIGRGHATRSRGDAKTFTCARSSPRQPSPRKPRAIACEPLRGFALGPGSRSARARRSLHSPGTRKWRVPDERAPASEDPGPRSNMTASASLPHAIALPRKRGREPTEFAACSHSTSHEHAVAPRTRSSHDRAAGGVANFGLKSRTRIIGGC